MAGWGSALTSICLFVGIRCGIVLGMLLTAASSSQDAQGRIWALFPCIAEDQVLLFTSALELHATPRQQGLVLVVHN